MKSENLFIKPNKQFSKGDLVSGIVHKKHVRKVKRNVAFSLVILFTISTAFFNINSVQNIELVHKDILKDLLTVWYSHHLDNIGKYKTRFCWGKLGKKEMDLFINVLMIFCICI